MTIIIFFVVILFAFSIIIDSNKKKKDQKSKKEIEWTEKFQSSKDYEEEMHEWLEEWDDYDNKQGYKENVNKFITEGYIKNNISDEKNIILSFKNPNK